VNGVNGVNGVNKGNTGPLYICERSLYTHSLAFTAFTPERNARARGFAGHKRQIRENGTFTALPPREGFSRERQICAAGSKEPILVTVTKTPQGGGRRLSEQGAAA
jgi:hypothetical protein